MRLTILETGRPPEALLSYGTYAQMIEVALQGYLPQTDFVTVSIMDGAHPSGDTDGVLITGSPSGVYDERSWIPPLEKTLQSYAANQTPVVGICFGHQILAQAYGGRVQKSDRGWGVGVHTYDVVGEGVGILGQTTLNCVVSHQDQVIEKPAGAALLAESEFCPIAALYYKKYRALSFQMHPEFSHDYARDLLMLRAGKIGQVRVEAALPTFQQRSDRSVILSAIARFFQQEGQF